MKAVLSEVLFVFSRMYVVRTCYYNWRNLCGQGKGKGKNKGKDKGKDKGKGKGKGKDKGKKGKGKGGKVRLCDAGCSLSLDSSCKILEPC